MFRHILKRCKLKNWPSFIRGTNLLKCTNGQNAEFWYRVNLNFPRSVSTAPQLYDKVFVDSENEHAFSVLPKISIFVPRVDHQMDGKVRTVEDFDQYTNRNWRQSSASEINEAFKNVVDYCISNNIPLSDTRLDKLVDGLMDQCEKLRDTELLELMQCIAKFPLSEGLTAHNYHDVWNCLDDICCWKMHAWEPEKIFAISEMWYQLGLGKVCDFVFEALDRMLKKVKRLTKDQLVYTFFYFNVCRRRPVDFEYEHAVADKVKDFNVDELGVIAMGFFKSKSRIKLVPILKQMIVKVAENSKTVDEVTLSAIVKTIRLSQHFNLSGDLTTMLDKLLPEIPRLSQMCCLQIALIGTSTQYIHPESLKKATQKIVADIENVRLKDVERILLANTMFNFDPETVPDFYPTMFNELHKPERRPEMVRYNRCLPAALNYLSIRNIYSYCLMNELLDEEYITESFGKNVKMMPRELVALDVSIDIECPDYKGNRLTPLRRYKGVKWMSEYAPSYQQKSKLSLSDKFFLEVADCVISIAEGREDYIIKDHVLPHFSRADIILCRDISKNAFVEPFGFQNYVFGDVKRPYLADHLKWYAIITLVPNIAIRNTSEPLGTIRMKERQLRTIGYTPIFVPWNVFPELSKDVKMAYLRDKLGLCDR